MTDEEVICRWMEEFPTMPQETYAELRLSYPRWWRYVSGRWLAGLAVFPVVEHLGMLHEVEARLSDEKRLAYIMALYPSYSSLKRETAWALLHATAAQKIAALAAVLRRESNETHVQEA